MVDLSKADERFAVRIQMTFLFRITDTYVINRNIGETFSHPSLFY